jgi:hypothetical protein
METIRRVLRSVPYQQISDLSVRAPQRIGGHHPRTLEVCIAIIIDGNTTRGAAKLSHMRERTARDVLVAGLDLYCTLAGWVMKAA